MKEIAIKMNYNNTQVSIYKDEHALKIFTVLENLDIDFTCYKFDEGFVKIKFKTKENYIIIPYLINNFKFSIS